MNQQLFESLQYFLTLMIELSLLFFIISFFVSLIQRHLSAEKISAILGAKSGRGYLTAAILGSVTPFCTCSTIPMLKGLIRAKAGFGPTLTFLFTSPLLNPIIMALFWSMLGWKVTLIYASVALVFSVIAGIVLSRLGYEKYIIDNDTTSASACCSNKNSDCCTPAEGENPSSCCCSKPTKKSKTWQNIHASAHESLSDLIRLSPFLIISGIAASFIHGYVPDSFLASTLGPENLFAIPVASIIGIPLYVRASLLVPIAASLLSKGVAMGTLVAMIIGGAGASLPEVILLRGIFKTPMIVAFLVVVLGMAITGGYLVQFII
ncbi:MAG: permease [Spirochaetia bacterium]